MSPMIVLLITAAMLAAQCYFGLHKRKLLGAIIPSGMAILFVVVSCLEKTVRYIPAGFACVVALAIVWGIGYFKSGNYQKDQLNKMKKRGL